MCSVCDQFGPGAELTETQRQQWLDQEDAWLRETIRRHGWAVLAVYGEGCWGGPRCGCGEPPGSSPPFAYTVGLYGFDHPEIVLFGMRMETSHRVLNDLGERVRRGEKLDADEPLTFDDWAHRIILFRFRDDGDIPVLIDAQRFYGRTRASPVPTMQAVWDDRWGRFPWEPGYDPPAGLQPMPGTFAP